MWYKPSPNGNLLLLGVQHWLKYVQHSWEKTCTFNQFWKYISTISLSIYIYNMSHCVSNIHSRLSVALDAVSRSQRLMHWRNTWPPAVTSTQTVQNDHSRILLFHLSRCCDKSGFMQLEYTLHVKRNCVCMHVREKGQVNGYN